MLLWEMKENRSHLDALVLLQTALVCSLGKGTAGRDPPAKPAAGPVPLAPSCIPMGKLCPHPVLGEARGRLQTDQEGGEKGSLSSLGNKQAEAGWSKSQQCHVSPQALPCPPEQPQLGSTRNKHTSPCRQQEKKPS